MEKENDELQQIAKRAGYALKDTFRTDDIDLCMMVRVYGHQGRDLEIHIANIEDDDAADWMQRQSLAIRKHATNH